MSKQKKSVKGKLLHHRASSGDSVNYAHRKKHHKAFRIRHVGLFLFALGLIVVGALGIGVYIGKTQNSAIIIDSTTTNSKDNNRLSVVKSSLGFSFGFDNEIFDIDATEFTGGSAKSVPKDKLGDDLPIISVNVKPIPKNTNPRDLATRLSVDVNENKQAVSDLKQSPGMQGKSDGEIAASVYNVASDNDFDVVLINSEEDTLDGIKVLKRSFQYTPKFGSQKSKVFSLQWTGIVEGRAISIHLKGLIGGTEIPSIYSGILETFNIKNGTDVLGLSTGGFSIFSKVSAADELESKYMADAGSPPVVKRY